MRYEVASMALYDIRRSIIVPIANSAWSLRCLGSLEPLAAAEAAEAQVLAVLASYGLVGALALQLPKIQATCRVGSGKTA